MSLILTPISQITPTPTLESNASLLASIATFNALNEHERKAVRVYCLATELKNKSVTPITTYNPDTAAGVTALVQDSDTVMGNIPKDSLMSAQAAIDWANARVVAGGLSQNLETLRGSVQTLVNFTDDELERMLIYLRLEIRA